LISSKDISGAIMAVSSKTSNAQISDEISSLVSDAKRGNADAQSALATIILNQ
jgi:hypothetical protein